MRTTSACGVFGSAAATAKLLGLDAEQTAHALGIAASSVATLRERAYRKLQIHGAGELFALCLQHAQPADVRRAQAAS